MMYTKEVLTYSFYAICWFMPSIIAHVRSKRNRKAIYVANTLLIVQTILWALLFGWEIGYFISVVLFPIGWIILLTWSLLKDQKGNHEDN